jgi:hypothetical protein
MKEWSGGVETDERVVYTKVLELAPWLGLLARGWCLGNLKLGPLLRGAAVLF